MQMPEPHVRLRIRTKASGPWNLHFQQITHLSSLRILVGYALLVGPDTGEVIRLRAIHLLVSKPPKLPISTSSPSWQQVFQKQYHVSSPTSRWFFLFFLHCLLSSALPLPPHWDHSVIESSRVLKFPFLGENFNLSLLSLNQLHSGQDWFKIYSTTKIFFLQDFSLQNYFAPNWRCTSRVLQCPLGNVFPLFQ